MKITKKISLQSSEVAIAVDLIKEFASSDKLEQVKKIVKTIRMSCKTIKSTIFDKEDDQKKGDQLGLILNKIFMTNTTDMKNPKDFDIARDDINKLLKKHKIKSLETVNEQRVNRQLSNMFKQKHLMIKQFNHNTNLPTKQ